MGMGSTTWVRFSALRAEWEHKGWLLTHGYRNSKGRRYNFAVKRIFSRANLGEPVPFNSLDDLLAYIEKEPLTEAPLPPVIVLPAAPAKLVRRSR